MPDVMVEQTALAGMTDILLLFYAMDGRTFQYIHDLKKVMPVQVSVLQRIRVGGSIFIFRMILRPYLCEAHIVVGEIKIFQCDDIGAAYFVELNYFCIGIADRYSFYMGIGIVDGFKKIVQHVVWRLLTFDDCISDHFDICMTCFAFDGSISFGFRKYAEDAGVRF